MSAKGDSAETAVLLGIGAILFSPVLLALALFVWFNLIPYLEWRLGLY